MFRIFSLALSYVFIFLIYYFIFNIIRLIYLDIKNMKEKEESNTGGPFLKLLTTKEKLDFSVESLYSVKQDAVIGRGAESDIKIEDIFISTKHAQITRDEDEFFIEDLESVNGTYLNGNRLEDVARLKNGDKVGIGLLEFVFVKETG